MNWVKDDYCSCHLFGRKIKYGSNRSQMFCESTCSEKFRKFHRKTTVLESLPNKVAGLQIRCFPVKFVKFLTTPISTKQLRWFQLNSSHQKRIVFQSKVATEPSLQNDTKIKNLQFILSSNFSRLIKNP